MEAWVLAEQAREKVAQETAEQVPEAQETAEQVPEAQAKAVMALEKAAEALDMVGAVVEAMDEKLESILKGLVVLGMGVVTLFLAQILRV